MCSSDLGAHPQVRLDPLPRTPGVRVTPDRPRTSDVSARTAPRALRETWRVGSYSGLVHGSTHESAAQDRDARAPSAELPSPAQTPTDEDILSFPRGNRAGHCVHAVFENADFTSSDGWPRVIREALMRHPPAPASAADALHAAQLRRMLEDVTQTSLDRKSTRLNSSH